MEIYLDSRNPAFKGTIKPAIISALIIIAACLLQTYLETTVQNLCNAYQGKLYGKGPLYAQIVSYPVWPIALFFLYFQARRIWRALDTRQIIAIDTDRHAITDIRKDSRGKQIINKYGYTKLKITLAAQAGQFAEIFGRGALLIEQVIVIDGYSLPPHTYTLPAVKYPGLIVEQALLIRPAPSFRTEAPKNAEPVKTQKTYSAEDWKRASKCGVPDPSHLKYVPV